MSSLRRRLFVGSIGSGKTKELENLEREHRNTTALIAAVRVFPGETLEQLTQLLMRQLVAQLWKELAQSERVGFRMSSTLEHVIEGSLALSTKLIQQGAGIELPFEKLGPNAEQKRSERVDPRRLRRELHELRRRITKGDEPPQLVVLVDDVHFIADTPLPTILAYLACIFSLNNSTLALSYVGEYDEASIQPRFSIVETKGVSGETQLEADGGELASFAAAHATLRSPLTFWPVCLFSEGSLRWGSRPRTGQSIAERYNLYLWSSILMQANRRLAFLQVGLIGVLAAVALWVMATRAYDEARLSESDEDTLANQRERTRADKQFELQQEEHTRRVSMRAQRVMDQTLHELVRATENFRTELDTRREARPRGNPLLFEWSSLNSHVEDELESSGAPALRAWADECLLPKLDLRGTPSYLHFWAWLAHAIKDEHLQDYRDADAGARRQLRNGSPDNELGKQLDERVISLGSQVTLALDTLHELESTCAVKSQPELLRKLCGDAACGHEQGTTATPDPLACRDVIIRKGIEFERLNSPAALYFDIAAFDAPASDYWVTREATDIAEAEHKVARRVALASAKLDAKREVVDNWWRYAMAPLFFLCVRLIDALVLRRRRSTAADFSYLSRLLELCKRKGTRSS